jgi:hypothetical protein
LTAYPEELLAVVGARKQDLEPIRLTHHAREQCVERGLPQSIQEFADAHFALLKENPSIEA